MRTVVNYVPNGFLDRGASATVTGSTDAESGLPIATGLTLGSFQEFNDAQALKYSSRGVNSVNILTAGSGQTPGTYTVTASAGGAVLQYVVAAGGTVTAQPTILTPGGPYTDAAVPTFTLPANGGTAATVQASIGVLYSGNYMRVQLDPLTRAPTSFPVSRCGGLRGRLAMWSLRPRLRPICIDWAGTNIDPNFGVANPYAFAQVGPGNHRVLSGASHARLLATDALTIDTTGWTCLLRFAWRGDRLSDTFIWAMPIATIAALSYWLGPRYAFFGEVLNGRHCSQFVSHRRRQDHSCRPYGTEVLYHRRRDSGHHEQHDRNLGCGVGFARHGARLRVADG